MNGARAVLCIAGRELRSFFYQPLAWVVLTALLLLNGWNFWLALESFNQAGFPAAEIMRFFFSGLLFWLPLIVSLPLIAMRLIAEERQTGTLETLLTAPVTEGEVTLGKYLAALGFFVVLFSPLALYTLLLSRLGEIDFRAAAGGFLGLLLVGGYLLSAAVCASALCRNQIVAAVVGFALVSALFLTPFLASFVATGDAARAALSQIDLLRTMDDFPRGLVDLRRIVYPVSGTAFFLFAAARLLEAAKGR